MNIHSLEDKFHISTFTPELDLIQKFFFFQVYITF